VKANDPFRFPAGKIIPALTTGIKGGPGATLAVFFSVFLHQNSTEKPLLSLEIVADGKQTAQAQPVLPDADATGRIPFLATLPLDTLAPGAYQLVATVRQGQTVAREMLGFEVE